MSNGNASRSIEPPAGARYAAGHLLSDTYTCDENDCPRRPRLTPALDRNTHRS